MTIIVWFRQDLRVADNPALYHAAQNGDVLPIYILDDANAGDYKMGAASRVWLHHALEDLDTSLGGHLCTYQGRADKVLKSLVAEHDIKGIYWNRCYEPWRIERDKQIKEAHKDLDVQSFNGSLLWEPWKALKDDGTPYKVFTPYYRKKCLQKAEPPRDVYAAPGFMEFAAGDFTSEALALLPDIPWDQDLVTHWDISEAGAFQCMQSFMDEGLNGYKEGRNFPAQKHVSRLSPYLHWGQISPHQIWHEAQSREDGKDLDHFLSEIGWREFSHSLLYHFPDLPRKNLQQKFDAFPWSEDEENLKAWQTGQTGYPIVDAGMRELYQTGYMHNRVRMIVGSFLVKNLLLHWHHGERWFWDTLFDADLANNSASWQWIAGCGADAAPYFRIFNCITQGEKFDKTGEYTRRFVPELKDMPDKYLFKPWEAPTDVLKQAGVVLGQTYPAPLVDVKLSRERALDAFKSLKEQA